MKLLKINSLFTKIALAVFSFAVIICIFIPYMNIAAVESVRNIDTDEKTFEIWIGKNAQTVNVVSELGSSEPMKIFSDEERTQTVAQNSIPLTEDVNTYWVEFYAYGVDVKSGSNKRGYVSLDVYKLVLNKGAKNDAKTKLSVDKKNKVITIDVAKTTAFDFSRVIDTKKLWCKFDNKRLNVLENRSETENEVTNVSIDAGATKEMYVAVALKSEINSDNEEKEVYYPLDMYELLIFRDDVHSTLPTVGEVGLGISSYQNSTAKGKTPTLYTSDTFMFVFMILSAVSTIFAFVIPSKFKIVSLVTSLILGVGLIAVPVLDYIMFFGPNGFKFAVGFFVLIALGVLIILSALLNFYRERDEYTKEQIRLYGDK